MGLHLSPNFETTPTKRLKANQIRASIPARSSKRSLASGACSFGFETTLRGKAGTRSDFRYSSTHRGGFALINGSEAPISVARLGVSRLYSPRAEVLGGLTNAVTLTVGSSADPNPFCSFEGLSGSIRPLPQPRRQVGAAQPWR